MLLLLRVKLLHGQSLFRSTTVKLLHGQSFFKIVPATHTRRSGAIKMTGAVAAGAAGQAFEAWLPSPGLELNMLQGQPHAPDLTADCALQ